MRCLNIIPIAGAALLVSATASADVVTQWNDVAIGVTRRLALSSNKSTRSLAITHLAIYDAVQSIRKTHRPYLAYAPYSGPISLEAAAATAAHDALLWLNPTEASELDYQLEVSLDAIADGDAKDNGILLGRKIATDLVFSRLADGSADTETYEVTLPADPDPLVDPIPGASRWRPTPRALSGTTEPAGLPALEPQWRSVTPFGITSPGQFRAVAPPALTSQAYADALNEVKVIGAINAPVTDPPTIPATGRSTEQTAIANFWRVATEIPFNAIARTVSQRRGLGIEENATLFALLNVALADSRVAIWESKYAFGLWRPITAIRLADRDGNAATTGDAAWRPLLETPAHPSYVSGHSGTGAAGAAVLRAIFGDTTSFSIGSDTLPNTVRSFTSFSQAARENADSRLYGGIHWRFDNEKGLELGEHVGTYVAEHLLLEVPPDPDGEGGAGGQGGEGGDGGFAGAGDAGGEGGVSGEGGESSGGTSGSSGSATGGNSGTSTGGRGGTGTSGSSGTGTGGDSGNGGATDPKPPSDDDDGCDCATAGRPTSAKGAWLAASLLALVALRRGRRRKRL